MRPWLLLGLLLAPAASAQGLYKWVDEKGVVHYTDQPPAGRTGKKLDLPPQPPLESQTSQRSRSWQEQLQDANERRFRQEQQEQEARQRAGEAEQKCLQARNALDTLRRERPIYRVDRQGERVYMEDEERQRLTAGWQRQAEAYCK
jgi:hypothetical protein